MPKVQRVDAAEVRREGRGKRNRRPSVGLNCSWKIVSYPSRLAACSASCDRVAPGGASGRERLGIVVGAPGGTAIGF